MDLRTRAIQMLFLLTATWAFSFPCMKALQEIGLKTVPRDSVFFATTCVTWRFGISALLMMLICRGSLRQFTRLEWKQGLKMGAVGGAGIVLQMDGMASIEASTSAFLSQGYCLWIPLWLAWRHRRYPSWAAAVSLLLVMAGVAVLSGISWQNLRPGRGEVETLVASMFFSAQMLWLERPEFARNDVNRFSLVMFAVMSVIALPVAIARSGSPADMFTVYSTPASWLLMAVLIGPCTLISFIMMNRWQRHIPATHAGLIYCVEPVFAALYCLVLPGWISTFAGIRYPNEQLGYDKLVGGGLITAANILILLKPEQPARVPTTTIEPSASSDNA